MAVQNELKFDGITPSKVYDDLIRVGVPHADAAVITGAWIYQNVGMSQRTFNYNQAFPAQAPACGPTFAPKFDHTPWVDGESVVQAGETATDKGFNWRFERIKEDIANLSKDVAQSFACLAEMRQALRGLLDEIRAELNRINSDIYSCCHRNRTQVPSASDFRPPFVEMTENNKFLGVVPFGEKQVSVWQTNQGLMMLPAVTAVNPAILGDPRVKRSASFARYITENTRVREVFRDRQVSREEFIRQFGADKLSDGQAVRELLDILPEGATFKTVEEMGDVIGDREAAALRTTAGTRQAVANAFRIEPETQSVASARLDHLTAIPASVRTTLLASGVNTVGEVAKLTPEAMTKLLRDKGLRDVTPGDAAEWTATAKTLSRLQ